MGLNKLNLVALHVLVKGPWGIWRQNTDTIIEGYTSVKMNCNCKLTRRIFI